MPEETFVIEIGFERRFTYCHKPSYLKAKAMVEQYSNAFYHCAKMERSQLNKAKYWREQGENELSDKYWEKAESWADRIDRALSGHPDSFFIQMNNMPIKD